MTTELEDCRNSSPAPHIALAFSFGDDQVALTPPPPPPPKEVAAPGDLDEDDEDDSSDDFDFTFAPVRNPNELPDVTADEIFSGGRILPAYPLFNRDLLHQQDASEEAGEEDIPMRRLLIDDIGAPRGGADAGRDRCDWSPKSAPQSPGRWKKSSSAGAGKTRRWKLRDLMGRSHSDGKEKFVFMEKASQPRPPVAIAKEKGANPGDRAVKNGKRSTEADMAAAHRLFYGKQGNGQAGKEAARRTSFLPYRQELYALFTPTNGLSLKPHQF